MATNVTVAIYQLFAIVGAIVAGLYFFITNVQLAGAGPVTTATCDGVQMSRVDICVESTYRNGEVVGTKNLTYDEVLAQQQREKKFVPWGIGIGVVVLGFSGWATYRWFGNHVRPPRREWAEPPDGSPGKG